MPNLLIIEDERKTADSIRQGLEEHGFRVDQAFDGEDGLDKALSKRYDVIITDRILPKMGGLSLCKELRRLHETAPILMLTALATTDDKIAGFDAGADDYLAKPFEFRELLARLKALLKRGTHLNELDRSLKVGDLELDLDAKKALRGGKLIDLTAKEFSLLEYLMLNRGRVVSKAEIAERVWGINFDTGTNVVEVYVNYLRKKIDRDFDQKLIHTLIGMGYVIRVEG
jgi:two-component system, OmpR family, copper resistance phosphate regulon response regulator CusR